jgi:hypothetical protein
MCSSKPVVVAGEALLRMPLSPVLQLQQLGLVPATRTAVRQGSLPFIWWGFRVLCLDRKIKQHNL